MVNEDRVTKRIMCRFAKVRAGEEKHLGPARTRSHGHVLCPLTPGENRGQDAGQGTLALTKGFGVFSKLGAFSPFFSRILDFK